MTFAEDGLTNFSFLFADVARLYASRLHRNALEVGMTSLQCRLLDVLSRNEGISQARLAQLMDADPMTVVRTLDSIRADTWLERLTDPVDRRANCLYLGAGAVPILGRMWRIADESRQQALAALSSLEREQLINLLARVRGTLLELEKEKETGHEYRSG